MNDSRKLSDLVSVGKATLQDFNLLQIKTVADLKRHSAEALYQQLCKVTGKKHDICCIDVFRAAIEQAKDPSLPREKCQWWYWSRLRKNTSP